MQEKWGGGPLVVALGFILALGMGCGGRMPEDLGLRDGAFQPCPSSPNCVSSFASDAGHAIAAFEISGSPDAAWRALEGVLEGLPRVEMAKQSENYLHAVFTTKLMRYRDDVEFHLDEARGRIDVRSASRVGYGDMNANRNRIESIRGNLAELGVVHRASASD